MQRYEQSVKIKKIAMVAVILILGIAALLPLAGGSESTENVWDKIALIRGNTTSLGGGEYLAIKTKNSWVGIIYGSEENPQNVKIVAEMERYAGGVKIYDLNGTLKEKKILKYKVFLGQSFKYIGEVANINESKSLEKYVPLKGSWHISDVLITNISSNKTRIDFTLYMENIPYRYVNSNETSGDGRVNRIALHFHITVQLQERKIRGFPWYSYNPEGGVAMDKRKNYTGQVVTFQIKYDKEIDGWDYSNESSKLVVMNDLFWGTSGRDKVMRFITNRYGGCRAMVGKHAYDNTTLPHHPIFFPHSGRIEFTEVGQWQRIGRFRWESNVTVDNETRKAYYQIIGGEHMVGWFNHCVFSLTVLNGALIYPIGNSIFQDPSIEVSEFHINFKLPTLPTASISMLGLVTAFLVIGVIWIYRFKK